MVFIWLLRLENSMRELKQNYPYLSIFQRTMTLKEPSYKDCFWILLIKIFGCLLQNNGYFPGWISKQWPYPYNLQTKTMVWRVCLNKLNTINSILSVGLSTGENLSYQFTFENNTDYLIFILVFILVLLHFGNIQLIWYSYS